MNTFMDYAGRIYVRESSETLAEAVLRVEHFDNMGDFVELLVKL